MAGKGTDFNLSDLGAGTSASVLPLLGVWCWWQFVWFWLRVFVCLLACLVSALSAEDKAGLVSALKVPSFRRVYLLLLWGGGGFLLFVICLCCCDSNVWSLCRINFRIWRGSTWMSLRVWHRKFGSVLRSFGIFRYCCAWLRGSLKCFWLYDYGPPPPTLFNFVKNRITACFTIFL